LSLAEASLEPRPERFEIALVDVGLHHLVRLAQVLAAPARVDDRSGDAQRGSRDHPDEELPDDGSPRRDRASLQRPDFTVAPGPGVRRYPLVVE
jgi:hypothetical protein